MPRPLKKSTTTPPAVPAGRLARQFAALVVFAAGLFLLLAVVTHDARDDAPVAGGGAKHAAALQNWGGPVGAAVARGTLSATGHAAYLLPFCVLAYAGALFRAASPARAFLQSYPVLMAWIAFLLLLSAGGHATAGGTLGKAVGGWARGVAGGLGAYLAGMLLLVGAIALLFRSRIGGWLERRGPRTAPAPGPVKALNPDEARVHFDGGGPDGKSLDDRMIFKPGIPRAEVLRQFKERQMALGTPAPFLTRVVVEGEASEEFLVPPRRLPPVDAVAVGATPEPVVTDEITYDDSLVDAGEADDADAGADAGALPVSRWQARKKKGAGPAVRPLGAEELDDLLDDDDDTRAAFDDDDDDDAEPLDYFGAAPPSKPRNRTYQQPDSALLYKGAGEVDAETMRVLRQVGDTLEKTFAEFNIEAKVTDFCRGPVVTRFEMSVPPGVKLARVVALQDNIALNLAAHSVRIEAPIPGKAAIGIEVPNRKRSTVTLRDILESPEFKRSKAKLPVALGLSVSGEPVVADLAAMPHVIIAGTTGSGKSVCVNAIICSILYGMGPERARLILVDPKYVELAPYDGIPHLLTPVINRPRPAVQALKWLVREMERRYQVLQKVGSRNIEGFNDKVTREKPRDDDGARYGKMPYLVLVIDELADLMSLAAKEIEDSISRLAAMSRAVGIHLIFATQRPSVDVITGVIKNNFPARIAFQVSSQVDSRTIIDSKGAEKLLGKGDSLYVGPGSPTPTRVQGAFLSEEEVEKTAAYLRTLGAPDFMLGITDDDADDEGGSSEDSIDADDPLYREAIEVVLETKRASASYLQRRLKVGYNRAARMIELMEQEGYIGPQQGSRPREILGGRLR